MQGLDKKENLKTQKNEEKKWNKIRSQQDFDLFIILIAFRKKLDRRQKVLFFVLQDMLPNSLWVESGVVHDPVGPAPAVAGGNVSDE